MGLAKSRMGSTELPARLTGDDWPVRGRWSVPASVTGDGDDKPTAKVGAQTAAATAIELAGNDSATTKNITVVHKEKILRPLSLTTRPLTVLFLSPQIRTANSSKFGIKGRITAGVTLILL